MDDRQRAQIDLLRSIGSGRGFGPPRAISGEAVSLAALSYSLTGEDLVLRNQFKWRLLEKKTGVYVDIGCGHPIRISNTYLFYSHGWRGLCVDANPGLAPSWARERPEDSFVCAAIGTHEGKTNFYRHTVNTGMSCVGEAKPSGEFEDGVRVPMFRLDRLLNEKIGDRQIDILTLDVEGAELGVLQSNDWSRWKPKAIMMECQTFDFKSPYGAPSVAYLQSLGYALNEKVGANVLMVLPD